MIEITRCNPVRGLLELIDRGREGVHQQGRHQQGQRYSAQSQSEGPGRGSGFTLFGGCKLALKNSLLLSPDDLNRLFNPFGCLFQGLIRHHIAAQHTFDQAGIG